MSINQITITSNTHNYQDLISLFELAFYSHYNTRLIKGDDEPVYLPANEHYDFHQIVFAHGYYASALHEISHWCLAGAERRLQEDFGYWYIPDGRNAEQQRAFEQVEIKPQAIEWAFCIAAGKRFNVSADNLSGDVQSDSQTFKKAVHQQVQHYLVHGFPRDAQVFIETLARFYQTPLPLCKAQFVR